MATENVPPTAEALELARKQRLELALALLARRNISADAMAAYKAKYPHAPEVMVHTVVFHAYVDAPNAVIDFLAEAELALRNPDHEISSGVTSHVLYHLYNLLMFQATVPLGPEDLVSTVDEIEGFIKEGDTEAARRALELLKNQVGGMLRPPRVE